MIPIVAFRFVSFIRLGPFLCPLLPTLASLPLLSYLSTSPLSSPPAFHPSLKNNRRQPAVRSAVWPPTHRNPAPPCFSFSPLPFWLVSRLCPASFLRPFTTLPDSALRLSCPASAPSCLGSFALHLVTSWSNLGSWPRFQSVRLAKKKIRSPGFPQLSTARPGVRVGSCVRRVAAVEGEKHSKKSVETKAPRSNLVSMSVVVSVGSDVGPEWREWIARRHLVKTRRD